VPFVAHMGASAVVAAVSTSKGDLGLVPAFAVPAAGAWWSALEFDAAPKIIARLPFVERADHPAALPVFVLSRVAADAMATDAPVWSVRVSGWGAGAAQADGQGLARCIDSVTRRPLQEGQRVRRQPRRGAQLQYGFERPIVAGGVLQRADDAHEALWPKRGDHQIADLQAHAVGLGIVEGFWKGQRQDDAGDSRHGRSL